MPVQRSALSVFFSVFVVVLMSHGALGGGESPNVVLFLADDMGYMDIGANNPASFYETPNIDKLAKNGMRFTDAYAACPVCSPTRASIMTGKYPPRTGITDWIGGKKVGKLLPAPNRDHLALDELTIAERMRDEGYKTFMAGKWHLGSGRFAPGGHGFDANLVAEGIFYYPPTSRPAADPNTDPKCSDRIADAAIQFIELNKDKPFFAYLPFNAVHLPLGARPELVAKYERKKAAPDKWGEEHGCKVRLVQGNVKYAAMVEQMDEAIGRVVEAIKRCGLAERTIVIFTSDNGGVAVTQGQPTCNLPYRGGKGWLYEGGIREPWIVVAPGVTKQGSVCNTPAMSTDIYPTILELAGIPSVPEQHRDGVSLLPLLKGDKLQRGPLFWHYPHYSGQGGPPAGAVRDGDWKLIEWYEDGRCELFNLHDDMGEQKNVADAHPETVKELQSKLDAWRKNVKAVMPKPADRKVRRPAVPVSRANRRSDAADA